MSTKTAQKIIKGVRMPAGDYYVGDPCYAVPNDRWMEWLEAADYEKERRFLLADLDGKPVLGIGTAFGDGVFRGTDGFDYGVDAGLIGVVPVSVGDYSDSKFPIGPAMTRVKFDRDFDCTYEDGTITIGHIEIDTDPSDDW